MVENGPIDYSSVPNPANMTDEEANRYFEKFEEVGISFGMGVEVQYRGVENLTQFVNEGRVGIGAIIRVFTYEWRDTWYMLTRSGWRRINSEIEDFSLHHAEDFLGKIDNGVPVAWSLEGHGFIGDDE